MSCASSRDRSACAVLAVALAAASLAGASGCASLGKLGWDGVIEVPSALPPDPASGPAVAIASVADRRGFARITYDLRRPSLYRELPDTPEVRARVVGRRDGTRGGNVLLPEGDSVERLVREAMVRALRETGHRVPGPGAADEAAPLEVSIDDFWAWAELLPNGVWRLESRARLYVRGPVDGLREGRWLCGRHVASSGGPGRAVWADVVGGALRGLASDLRAALGAMGAGPSRCSP